MSPTPPRGRESAENPFWITYSDLLSSLVMVFLVLILAFQTLSSLQAKQLQEQAEKLRTQAEELKRKNDSLENAQSKIRSDQEKVKQLNTLLSELKREFGDTITVTHGEVHINESLLFPNDSAALTPKGQAFLQSFVGKWSDRCLREEFVGHAGQDDGVIERVVLEGRADPKGVEDPTKNYLHNLTLTLERVNAVTRFISTQCAFKSKQVFLAKLAATGRSHTDALLDAGGGTAGRDWTSLYESWTKEKLWTRSMPQYRSVILKLTFRNPVDLDGSGEEGPK